VFVGRPGATRTSSDQSSIARDTGRKFQRIAPGGGTTRRENQRQPEHLQRRALRAA